MAKKSQRRLVHHERGQSGCMSGLISIFDFRQGRSTRKLLSDRKHGSSRRTVDTLHPRSRLKLLRDSDEKDQREDVNADKFSDGDETKMLRVDISKTSVKKLMEEDMSNEQQTEKQIPNVEMEQIRSDPELRGHVGKKNKQTKKLACDISVQDSKASATLKSQESYQPNSSKQFSHLDITSLMEEFCSQIHHRHEIQLHHESGEDSFGSQESTNFMKLNQLDEFDMHLVQKHSALQEKLSEAAEAFLNQKIIDSKQLTGDGAIHQSKQFMDSLEILNSNKDLLLRLLQDSNSLLAKHIQELQDAPSEKVDQNNLLAGGKLSEEIGHSRNSEELICHKQVQKQNIHKFFKKKDKSQKRDLSKESDNPQASNRIVVLKPNTIDIQNSVTATGPSSSLQSHYNLRNPGWTGRFNSQFSLSEIKRRLKNTMGETRKDRHVISTDGIPHKTPKKRHASVNSGKGVAEEISRREFPSKSHFHIERTTEPSTSGEREDKIGKPTHNHPSTDHEVTLTTADGCKNLTMTATGYPKQRESNIYAEAKKHLEEILSSGDEDGGFANQQDPKTLGRILALPDYNSSPVFSPGREKELGFVTAQMRFSPNGTFRIVSENIWRLKPYNKGSRLSPSTQNLENQQHAADGNQPEIKLQEVDSKPDTSEKLLPDTEIHENICSKGDTSPKGDAAITEATNVASVEEDNLLDGPSESISSTPFINTGTAKICEEEGNSKFLELESPTDSQPPSSSISSFSSRSVHIQKAESEESINDPPERPSPVSVLDSCFLEEISSPTTTTSQSAELPMEPLHIHLEEHDYSTLVVTTSDLQNYSSSCMEDQNPSFEYVTAVLRASNVNWDEFWEKYNSSELLLNPSLFDEMEVIYNQLCVNRRLLFDCINEVLVELYDRYFGSSQWVAFVSLDIRPAPIGKSIIREVWEGINWNLLPPLLPRTLDQIVGKDMEKTRIWMDFRSDTESIGNEMVEVILDELMEDILFDLCS